MNQARSQPLRTLHPALRMPRPRGPANGRLRRKPRLDGVNLDLTRAIALDMLAEFAPGLHRGGEQ